MTANSEDRITSLEEPLAFQDQAIEDLNETITAQWKVIDTLKRDLARLTDELREMEEAARDPKGAEPPPPHY